MACIRQVSDTRLSYRDSVARNRDPDHPNRPKSNPSQARRCDRQAPAAFRGLFRQSHRPIRVQVLPDTKSMVQQIPNEDHSPAMSLRPLNETVPQPRHWKHWKTAFAGTVTKRAARTELRQPSSEHQGIVARIPVMPPILNPEHPAIYLSSGRDQGSLGKCALGLLHCPNARTTSSP